jgi:hypothetical protein
MWRSNSMWLFGVLLVTACSAIHQICFLCTVSSGNIAYAMQGTAADFDPEDIYDPLFHDDTADAKVSNHFKFCDCACTPDQCCASCWSCAAHALCSTNEHAMTSNPVMQAETTAFDQNDIYDPLSRRDDAGTKVTNHILCCTVHERTTSLPGFLLILRRTCCLLGASVQQQLWHAGGHHWLRRRGRLRPTVPW